VGGGAGGPGVPTITRRGGRRSHERRRRRSAAAVERETGLEPFDENNAKTLLHKQPTAPPVALHRVTSFILAVDKVIPGTAPPPGSVRRSTGSRTLF